ncbi:YidH family protein [Tundrisphaera lichenicola]|uniref:YidH family protein n=1 Tax=Tundrisphaera lichenicola TaxID=2029860 RepID=UPI003EC107D0
MDESNDPRVYFAAERTLLAWVRTGLTVMGLGFVVARFGLFLQLLERDTKGGSHIGSTLIGVGLVFLGSAAIAASSWQHYRFCKTLGPGSEPRPSLASWSLWFSAALSLVGAILAVYILVRSGGK